MIDCTGKTVFPVGLIDCPTNRCAVKWLRPPPNTGRKSTSSLLNGGLEVLLVTNQAGLAQSFDTRPIDH
jgi:hypothetical protein